MLTTVLRTKEFIGLTDESQDARIEELINVGTNAIEMYCRRMFVRAVYEEVHEETEGQYLQLRNFPIASVINVARNGGQLKGWKTAKEKGLLIRSDWPPDVSVEYEGGYTLPADGTEERPTDLPRALEAACILFVQYALREERLLEELPDPVRSLIQPFRSDLP